MEEEEEVEANATPNPKRTYQASLDALNSTQLHGDNLRRAYSARRETMVAMRTYVRRLGLDEATLAALPTLHVTGSKGKGSTCAFVEAVLRRQGVHTVLFTSPHLVRVNERIRVDGRPLTDAQWTKHFWAVWDRLHQAHHAETEPETVPGYFRFLTLLGVWVALQEKADVLVLEVGVGGRFDATNVVPRPVACAITTLDLEHTDLLGNTIEDIAWEKGGIIKPGVPCFVGPQLPQFAAAAMRVLRECAAEAGGGAPLVRVKPLPSNVHLGIVGDVQAINAGLALALVQQYHTRAATPATTNDDDDEASWVDMTSYLEAHEPTVREGLHACSWPGRCQRIDWGPKCTFFVDGAHTEESMRIAVEWFDSVAVKEPKGALCRRRRGVLVFNCGEEKTVPDLLGHLVARKTTGPEGDDGPLRFDVVLFCPVASAKPTLAQTRPARAMLLEGPGEGGREVSLSYAQQLDREALTGLCDAVEEEKRRGAETPSLPWQHALRNTWRVLQAYHLSTGQQPPPQKDDNAKGTNNWAARLEAGDQAARTIVKPSVGDALEEIKAMMADGEALPLDVLVTGSLYLVGNVLGWLEKEGV